MNMVHVTIQTADLDKSMKFYEDVVGLKMTGDLRPMGAPIVFLADPFSMGATAIELIENPDAAYNGSGISIGFHTDDVIVKRKELEAAGLEPTDIIRPNPNTKFFFVKDPNGVQIQFI